MKTGEWIKSLDESRIVSAIQAAERRSSCEIRVFVTRHELESDHKTLSAARREMVRLGITRTQARNGVLIYLVPATRRVAVVADDGASSRIAPDFWNSVVGVIIQGLKAGPSTDAVISGIEKLAEELAYHFPASSGDTNELPDSIARDH